MDPVYLVASCASVRLDFEAEWVKRHTEMLTRRSSAPARRHLWTGAEVVEAFASLVTGISSFAWSSLGSAPSLMT